MPNASDRKHIRELEKLSKREAQERGAVVVGIASTESGRAYLWSQLERAHIFTTSFVSNDPLAMAFSEGERNQGLSLLNDIMQWCPEQFVQMMVENNVRRSARNIDNARHDDANESAGESAGGEGSERDDQGPGSRRDPADDGYNLLDYDAEARRFNGQNGHKAN